MIPFRRWLGAACVHLGWSPAEFWAATPHELYAALEALNPKTDPAAKARRELEALKKAHGDGDE